MMRKITAISISIFICLVSVGHGERLAPLGVEIPVPIHDNWILPEDTIYVAPGIAAYDILLFLSRDGCVDSLLFHSKHRDYMIKSMLPSLYSLDFEPAVYAEDSIPFILPGEILFLWQDGFPRAELRLPFEANGGAVNRELTLRALELNGFVLPKVLEVPSYFCLFKDRSETEHIPYVIFRIELDLHGELQDIDIVQTNYEQMADIMHSVLLYSKFQGASYKGEPISSRIYVTIRFFMQLGYPVPVWPSKTKPGLGKLLSHCRIDFLPYSNSILSPAIPLNIDNGYFVGQKRIYYNDTLAIDVVIDRDGRVASTRFRDAIRIQIRDSIIETLKTLQFLPARDNHESTTSFAGKIILIPNFSKRIRILVNWLPIEFQTYSD